MVYEALPSVVVGVTEVLPREWNWYTGHQGNSHLPFTMDNIRRLNNFLFAMANEYRNCWFVRYSDVFNPEMHLGRDGLHVNHAGAIVLKEALESAVWEFTVKITEPLPTVKITEPLPAPIEVEEIAPCISYADVVKLIPTDEAVPSLSSVCGKVQCIYC